MGALQVANSAIRGRALEGMFVPVISATDTHDRRATYHAIKRSSRSTRPCMGRSRASGGTTQFLYDGDQLVAEYDSGGNLVRRYLHGSRVDEPMLWYEGTGFSSRRAMLADHQGSIVAVADAGDAAVSVNGFDAWGVPNDGNLGLFQCTGQIWLPEIGLYHYKARVYSPQLGRFLQTDPVGYHDQAILYARVGNDPLNHTDPTGAIGTSSLTSHSSHWPPTKLGQSRSLRRRSCRRGHPAIFHGLGRRRSRSR